MVISKRKRLHLTLIILLWGFICNNAAYGNIILVQNGQNTILTSTLDSAILLAQNNAYIYLPGNYSFSLSNATISKRLNIVGAGYNLDSSKTTGISTISTNITFGAGSQFSTIEGVVIPRITISTNNIVVSRVRIMDRLILSVNVNEITVSESILEATSGSNTISGSIVTNCNVNKCIITQSSGKNCLSGITDGIKFSNNIFLNLNTGGAFYTLSGISNCIFENNIFTQPSSVNFDNGGGSNNVFNNNLFVRPSFSLPGTSNQNIFNENLISLFANAPPLTPWNNYQNYHLGITSLGINTGSDGTDVGIYGTNIPFKDGGLPFNPHVQLLNISNPNSTNGQLNISIKIVAQPN